MAAGSRTGRTRSGKRRVRKAPAKSIQAAAPSVATTEDTESVQVVGSTMQDLEIEAPKAGSDLVTLCVSLRSGHKFTDVPNGKGGVKTVRLPGLNDELKGTKGGILSAEGNCKYVTMPRADWEFIKRAHGREGRFLANGNHSPAVFEIPSIKAKESRTVRGEIATMSTGFAPINPQGDRRIAAKVEVKG